MVNAKPVAQQNPLCSKLMQFKLHELASRREEKSIIYDIPSMVK